VRALLLSFVVLAAGCQLDEPTIGGTIVAVAEIEAAESRDDAEKSGKYYDPPLVPEVGWKVEVHLDNGSSATVTHHGSRRYAPGERVRLIVDESGELLL
jgi:hypothetical protein